MDEAIRRAMKPSAREIAALSLSSHAEIVRELLGGKGHSALDVGCGAGPFTWLMAPLFQRLAGLDVKAKDIVAAREAAKKKGLDIDFQVGSAEAMPFADKSFDVVVFSNSLHHIPGMDQALAEAARVVKPGGLVYVMEPVPSGTYFEATRLVNDETDIRTEAYRCLRLAASVGLAPHTERLYRARRGFTSLEEWADDQIARDAKRGALFEQHKDEIRRRFEGSAQRENGQLVFDQVSRVNVLRKKG